MDFMDLIQIIVKNVIHLVKDVTRQKTIVCHVLKIMFYMKGNV